MGPGMSECKAPGNRRPVTDLERQTLLARIMAKVVEDGGCLLWQGATGGGQPIMRHRGGRCYVRRLVHEALTGRHVPAGKVASARCRNPACVSPDCLLIATLSEIRQIDAQRGIYSTADGNLRRLLAARAKATIPEALVVQAREFVGTSAQAAAATGISVSHVKRIRSGHARGPVADVWRALR